MVPTITLTEPGPLSIDNLIPTDVLCNGEATGSITAAVSGNGPFIYVWERTDGQAIVSVNSSTITDLVAGEYRLRITDQSTNPEASATVTIGQPALALEAVATPTDSSCSGASDGIVTINATGGTGAYSYSLDGFAFQTGDTFTGLTAGEYGLTVRDVNGCEFTVTAVVGEPIPITFSVPVSTNISASGGADGTIGLSVTGGSGAYIYEWTRDGLPFTPPDGSTDTELVGLQAGIYGLTVSDSANPSCSATLVPSITLTQPGPLSIDNLIPTDVLCNGEATGSITAAVSGIAPFSFLWERTDGQALNSVDNTTITGLGAGEYRLTLTDASTNPAVVGTVTVVEPTEGLTGVTTPTDASCFGANDGAVAIIATGGTEPYIYSLDGITFQADNIFTNLIAGDYNLIIQDANGCEFPTSAIVTEPNEIIVTTDLITNASIAGANDGAISISINGGTPLFETVWSGPNGYTSALEDITDLTAGIYTLEIRDANYVSDESGCYFSQEFTIIEPEALIISDIVPTDASCRDEANGSINTTVIGEDNLTFNWTMADGSPVSVSNGTNGEDITGILAGSYIVTVSDGNSTVTSNSIVIGEPATNLTIQNINSTDSTCNGENDGTIQVLAIGGTPPYQYSLNGIDFQNGATFNNLSNGQYTVSIRDANDCTFSALSPELISEPQALNFIIDDQLALTAANASDGAINITPSGGSGDYAFNWTGPSFSSTDQDISNLESGDYFLTMTDMNNTNCSLTSAAITIAEPGVLLVTSLQTVFLECNGDDFGEITASVQGGLAPFTYEWFQIINGNNNQLTEDTDIIANLVEGTYFVRVTDANNIVANATPINIDEPDAIQITVDATTNIQCTGESTGAIAISVSGGTSPYQFVWSNGLTVEDINGLDAGTYIIEVIDDMGCFTEESITITAPVDPVQISDASITNVSDYLGLDGSITLEIDGGSAPYTFLWSRLSDNSNLGNQQVISNLTADSYAVLVTDNNGCTVSEAFEITQPDIVEDTIVQPICNGQPNGSISVSINQGNGEFTYEWNTGATTSAITELPAGTYSVTIRGFGNGPVTRTYVLEDPEPLVVDIGTDSVLCANQILELDATVDDETATYVWSSDNGFNSTLPQVTLTETGNYTVMVQSGTGCTAEGTIFVDISTEEIDAEFAVSSQVFVGENIVAVDISYPQPEGIEWIVPDEAEIVTQNTDAIEFSFTEAGEYDITIMTTRGSCTAQKTKKVIVVAPDASVMQEDTESGRKLVEDFLIYPNPTDGRFTAQVNLSERGNISIKVFSFANNALMASANERGELLYNIPFDLSGFAPGVYAVLLETPYGNTLRKVVKK